MKEYFIGVIKNKSTVEEDFTGDGFLTKETIYNVDSKDYKNIEAYSNNHDLRVGDNVYIEKSVYNNNEYYTIGEYVRYPGIILAGVIFLFIVFILFGKKAFRSIFSLILSLGTIFFVLLPLTIHGWNPLLVSSVVSVGMLLIIMYITHGINRVTTAALLDLMLLYFLLQ